MKEWQTMADNIEQLIDIDNKEKKVSPELLENYEKLNKQNIDLSNLLAILNTAGEKATELLFNRILGLKDSKDQ